jgi:hypothetical protein
MPTSKGIEFTLKRDIFGKAVLYVRETILSTSPGMYHWGRWRPANLNESSEAIVHLRKLNKS